MEAVPLFNGVGMDEYILKGILASIILMLYSCTFNLYITQSHGHVADDVVDSSPTSTTSAKASIPGF